MLGSEATFGTLAYLLPSLIDTIHSVRYSIYGSPIRNINMRRYITSARGHELSGRVRTHANNEKH